jgi:hypothetical protein
VYSIYYLRWFLKAKKNIKENLPIPKTSINSALLRGRIYYGLVILMTIIYLLLFIIDFTGGLRFPLFYILVPTIGIGVIMWYKKKKYTAKRSRSQNIVLFSSLILLIGMVLSLVTIGLIFSNSGFVEILLGIENEIPNDYKVLKLNHFGIEEEPRVKRFSQSSSIKVPKSYEYHELGEDGKVRTYFYEAADSETAEYIFQGMLEKEGSLMFRKIVEASKEIWNADRAYYLKEDKSMVILLKDNNVVLLDGNMDFSKSENIKTAAKQLGIH